MHPKPQPPQLACEICRLTHVPEHPARPWPQHTPPPHLVPLGHAFPQVPQLLLSVWVFVQTPLHIVSSTGNRLHLQDPMEQNEPPVHACPHAPQLLLSLAVLRHTPPQLVLPVPLGQAQTPAWQDVPLGQITPQLPQLLLL